MAFSKKQTEYFKNANHRWNIKSGATRSGKTYMDYFVIPKRVRRVKDKDGLVVILGNTKGTLQRNIILPLQNLWGTSLVSDIRSDNTATLFGQECFCLGADKINQVDRLRGSSIKYCYGDEVVTWHQDVFGILKSRLDKPYSKFDGTCNPEGPKHWFKQFIDSDADIYHQHYTIDDNPFLAESVKAELKKEYAGSVFYDRYILGNWVLANGLIYQFFTPDMCIEPQNKYDEYYISIDYGTLNPFAALLVGVDYKQEKADIIKELYYDGRKTQRQLTDSEYYQKLVDFSQGYNIDSIIIDPSAASMITEIRRHDAFDVRKAKNDVVPGIGYTASVLSRRVLNIGEGCKNTLEEIGGYAWDEKAPEDKPIKENDHAMDAMRYFAYTILKPMGW